MASTLAYVLLYLGLRTALAAQPANAVSLLVTAVLNTAVNRRFTFGIRGRPDLAAASGPGAARVRRRAGADLRRTGRAARGGAPARPAAEVTVLIGASLAATVIRFVLYRHWVFRERRAAPGARPAAGACGPPGAGAPRPCAAAAVPSRTTESNGHHQ